RAAVLDEAINIALPQLYVSAAQEHDVRVLGRPEVDIKELVDNEKLSFTVEVDVRPKLDLPNLDGVEITVDAVEINEAEIDEQIESLRIRFGTLTTVEKKAENGDFVSLNLVARVNGEVVDGGTANNISYEVGSDKMLPGLDEALQGMSANETKTFQTELFGGEPGSGGEVGDVDVTLNAVKKRELPTLDAGGGLQARAHDVVDVRAVEGRMGAGRAADDRSDLSGRQAEEHRQNRSRAADHQLWAAHVLATVRHAACPPEGAPPGAVRRAARHPTSRLVTSNEADRLAVEVRPPRRPAHAWPESSRPSRAARGSPPRPRSTPAARLRWRTRRRPRRCRNACRGQPDRATPASRTGAGRRCPGARAARASPGGRSPTCPGGRTRQARHPPETVGRA
ncbi:MAG: hypothetical protein EBR52_09185, partial [Microbacteriaceae bacterium]|nr:hypothetical protein [Microbacteriaceae bacterium]